MPTYKNRIGQVSATTGTGPLTLGAAETGYKALAADMVGDFLIEDGTAWEIARDCAYTNSGATLTRGTLEDSSTNSVLVLSGSQKVYQIQTATRIDRVHSSLNGTGAGGRLTLTSGTPVTTADVTAATTIYYTPAVHNVIGLWDGSSWVPTIFAETAIALGTLTSAKPYDVFGYLSAGVLTLELLAWTDDTNRATAATLQDGRYCKSGDKTRLLLGSFYTTSTTTTEDSVLNRYLSNASNTIQKSLSYTSGDTGHSYPTGTFRPYNNSTAARVNIMCALAAKVSAAAGAIITATVAGQGADTAIGINSTTTGSPDFILCSNANTSAVRGSGYGETIITAGKNYLQMLERGNTNGASYSFGLLKGGVSC